MWFIHCGALMTTPLIYLSAGEVSGDLLGARLMRALKEKTQGNIRFAGIGGPHMIAEGLKSLFPMEELSLMGLVEVIPHIPRLKRRIKQTINDVLDQKPDCFLSIDAPGFNFRVAKALKGQGISLVHYVAPTVWAWKPKRAKKIAQFLDHLLVLLPFEPPYFEKEKLPTTFVGHSVLESGIDQIDGAAFRDKHGVPQDVSIVCVLPGSRRTEVSQLLPIFQETLERIKKKHPSVRVVLPTVPAVSHIVRQDVAQWAVPVLVVEGEGEKFGAFKAANVALAASGTVSLELAQAGTPSIIAYKVKKITHWLAKRLIRVKYASIVNILHDREIMPEFIQDQCTPDNLSQALDLALAQAEQADQREALNSAMVMLGKDEAQTPSERAACTLMSFLKKREKYD